jgi:hypothetical protein
MQDAELSEDAVALFRFRVRGYRVPVTEQRLAAFRELVAAGIMRPDGEDFAFTEEGWERRHERLAEEEDRIERGRSEPPDVTRLSAAAWELLRRRAGGENVAVTPENLPAYRELAEARVMYPVSGFTTGPEALFRFTYYGWDRRGLWLAHPT